MKLDRNSNTPLYMQIVSHMKQLIKQGNYPMYKRISMRKLASDYGVSRGVIENAIELLKSEGLIESRPKSGIYIKENAWYRMMEDAHNWGNLLEKGVHQSNRAILKDAIDRGACADAVNAAYYGFNDEEFDSYAPLKAVLKKLPDYTSKFNTLDKRGIPELRIAVCRHMAMNGINVNPDNIVIFPSWVAALNTVVYSILSQGSDFYTAEHDNASIMRRVTSTGANLFHISADEQGISAEELSRRINPKKNNLLYINPVNHFPTGKTISEGRRTELLDLMKSKNIPVMENDLLRDLWVKPPPPPMKKDDNNEQIIYTGTFANTYNTAIHMAWVASPSVLVERLCDVKIQLYGLNQQVSEILSFLMLDTGIYYSWVADVRRKLPARTAAVNNILERHLGKIARWNPDNVLYHIWLEFPKGFSSNKLFNDCANIYFMPGSVYYDNACILLNSVTATLSDLEYVVGEIAKNAQKQLH